MKSVYASLVMLLLICCTPIVHTNEKPVIVASFYPLYFFTSEIVGNSADVVSLVPTGVEPHDWEPTPSDIITVQRSDLFVTNGAGLESWAQKLIESAHPRKVVIATDAITLLPALAGEEGENAVNDPHVWLDPVLAEQQVRTILSALIFVHPENKELYETNAHTLLDKLQILDDKFKKGLSSCARKEIFTSHAAFAYLSKEYGLNQVPLSGLSPDAEPTPGRMAELVRMAKQDQVTYIFFEALVSPKISESLAREAGAQTLVLDPIEGLTEEEVTAGKNYLSVMEQNLNNLRIALNCP